MAKPPFSRRSGGKRSAGPFGKRDRGGDTTMHLATCANCGDSCEVPFLPKGKKPVYCNKCFKQFGKGEGEESLADEPRLYPATCGNCGNECTVPFRPVQGKPVFCKNCFGKYKGSSGQAEGNNLQEQLDRINMKLDNILRALATRPSRPAAPARDFQRTGKNSGWRKDNKKRF